MQLPSLRPVRDTLAAWRFRRALRARHPDVFGWSDAFMGFSRILAPHRLRHRIGAQLLGRHTETQPDPAGGFRVHVRPLGLDFFWPSPSTCDTWYALEQEVSENNPHCYTTAPIRLGPDSVVIDVGACEGLFAFRALRQKLAREVIAFEPFPAMAELLRRGAVANGITHGLHHEPFAVSNHNGPVGFRTDLGADSSQVILNPPANFQGVVVQSIRLDDYLARTGRKLCEKDLLKIDAEGADFDVLRGAEKTIRETAPQIAVTTYHVDEHASGILEWLQRVQPRYRYRLKGFSYWTTTPRPVLLQASALA